MDIVVEGNNTARHKGKVISIVVHLLLLLIILFYPLKRAIEYPLPDDGILIDFGDATSEVQASTSMQGSAAPAPSNPRPSSKAVVTPVVEKEPEVKESRKEILRDEKEAEKPISKESEKPEQSKSVIKEEESLSKVEENADASEALAEKSREKRRENEQKKSQAKSKFSSLLDGAGSGESNEEMEGSGNNNVGEHLSGLSDASGMIGGGLGGREVLKRPRIVDDSQKSGRVIIEVCVGSSGKIESKKFVLNGSTTSDAYLVKKSKKFCDEFLFSSSDRETQCGTITFDYQLQ